MPLFKTNIQKFIDEAMGATPLLLVTKTMKMTVYIRSIMSNDIDTIDTTRHLDTTGIQQRLNRGYEITLMSIGRPSKIAMITNQKRGKKR